MSNHGPFQPGNIRGHVYLLAAGYLVYLTYEIARDCLSKGAANAIELGGMVLLAAGAALLGFLSWKQYHTPPVFDGESPEEEREDAPLAEPEEFYLEGDRPEEALDELLGEEDDEEE